MPPTTRSRGAPVTATSPALDIPPKPNGITYMDRRADRLKQFFNPSGDNVSDPDSGDSEYEVSSRVKKRKVKAKEAARKKRHTLELRRGEAAAVPEISDDEYSRMKFDDEDDDLWAVARRNKEIQAHEHGGGGKPDNADAAQDQSKMITLQIKSDCSTAAIIHLNLGDILKSRTADVSECGRNSTETVGIAGAGDGDSVMSDTTSVMAAASKPTGFLDCAPEIRLRIYRLVFAGKGPVNFGTRTNFCRSSALLRTCKTIHEEGRVVLYGENAFHFTRNHEIRGAYWEQTWSEIGYKDVRRFLEAIGPINISCLKFVSFFFTDGGRPLVKFVNDGNVLHICRLLGANATLKKFNVLFGGRSNVTHDDFHFLKAFTEITCHELTFYRIISGLHGRMARNLKDKLCEVMEVPFYGDEGDDGQKPPRSNVMMVHDDDLRWYSTFD